MILIATHDICDLLAEPLTAGRQAATAERFRAAGEE
jgi:hypothetical protein